MRLGEEPAARADLGNRKMSTRGDMKASKPWRRDTLPRRMDEEGIVLLWGR